MPGFVNVFRLTVVVAIDLCVDTRPDPGSKPSLVAAAFAIDPTECSTSRIPKKAEPETNVSMKPECIASTLMTDEEELPEDRFHRRDVSSSFILSQREQAHRDTQLCQKSPEVSTNDSGTEVINVDDFRHSHVQTGFKAEQPQIVENGDSTAFSELWGQLLD